MLHAMHLDISTGCLKKNATEIKQAVVYHKRG
jgi:hypothetical protein